MTTQMLIYNSVEPVNREKHRNLYVQAGGDYSFTSDVNSVPVVASEMPLAAAEFPIVFIRAKDNMVPTAILGAEFQENLFLAKDNTWKADYVPAFVRRYPFVFASTEQNSNKLALCIDENYIGCNHEGHGERLFDASGERTPYLNKVMKFLEEYRTQFQRTQKFCNMLGELDLFEPVVAQYKNEEGTQKTLSGMLAVSRKKLKALSPEQMKRLVESDAMELIYAQLHSLRNFQRIFKLRQTRHLPTTEALTAQFDGEEIKEGA